MSRYVPEPEFSSDELRGYIRKVGMPSKDKYRCLNLRQQSMADKFFGQWSGGGDGGKGGGDGKSFGFVWATYITLHIVCTKILIN